jgi:hypothetical protein
MVTLAGKFEQDAELAAAVNDFRCLIAPGLDRIAKINPKAAPYVEVFGKSSGGP